jgi:hypothetical protein
MALKARINKSTYDALPDVVRAEYSAVEGTEDFLLSVDPVGGFALENIDGLKSTLAKKNTEVNTLKGQLKGFMVDGEVIDPTTAIEAIAKFKSLGNLSPEEMANQKVQAALQQQKQQFDTQLSKTTEATTKLKSKLEAVMIDQAATAALAGKGGNVKLLLPHVKSHVKIVEDNGDFKVVVVDDEGNTKLHVEGGKATDMSLEQLVQSMASDDNFASAFNAKGVPGGGTTPGKNGNNSTTSGAVRVIPADDTRAVGGSLKDIAAGKATVAMD